MSDLGERIRRSVDEVAPPIDLDLIVAGRADRHDPRSFPRTASIAGGVAVVVATAIWAVAAAIGGDAPQPTIAPAPVDLVPAAPIWPASVPAPPATRVDGSTRLEWQRLQLPDGADLVVDGGDRVLAATTSTLQRSFDGAEWSDVWPDLPAEARRIAASEVLGLADPIGWQDVVVGLLAGYDRVVRIVDADGQVHRHAFERPVAGLGIGPHGAVASAAGDARLDDAVRELVGPAWALPNLRSAQLQDGLLLVVDQQGREAKADLREHGYNPRALSYPHGWYAAPGASWTSIEGLLGPVDRIVGTRGGFFGVASQSNRADGVWFSPDGKAWEHLPLPDATIEAGELHTKTVGRWNDGAVVSVRTVDRTTTHFIEVTPEGTRTLFTTDLQSRVLPPRSTAVASGPVGILVTGVDGRVLYSPTGEDARPLDPPAAFNMPPEERWPYWPHVVVTGNVAVIAGGDLDEDFVSQWWRLTPTDEP
jgi:hypothetical protein